MSQNLMLVVKYFLVAAVIIFISFLFPKHKPYSSDHFAGEIWKDEALIAPFDFPIRKSTQVLDEERNQVEAEFYPIFKEDTSVVNRVFNEIEGDIRTHIEQDTLDAILNWTNKLINDLYSKGILEEAYPEKWERDHLQLRKGNAIELVKTNSVSRLSKSKQEASTKIMNSVISNKSAVLTLVLSNMEANIVFDQDLTEKFLAEELEKISPNAGMVSKGQKMIGKGEVVTESVLQTLVSLDKYYQDHAGSSREGWTSFAGYLALTIMLVGVLLLYLQLHFQQIFKRFSSLAFMLFWTVLYSYLVFAVEQTDSISTYMIPFCIVPIVIKNFYNDSLALYVHLVVVLIASFLSNLGYEFTFLQLLAGIVAVLTSKETRLWFKFFQTIFFIILTYAIGYMGLSLVEGGELELIEPKMYLWFLLNGVLTLLAYPMIPLLERIFGYTSSITLAELNDLNHPLLKDLSVKAPGTFQHSLQVGNLSEAAAEAINANSLLVKVGSLYHDIGKMNAPQFFIENQVGKNPHEELEEKASAEIIIKHVTEGTKMATRHRLPKVVIDFIKTHHGTTRVEYFYRTFKEKHPDALIDEAAFTYPGPKPETREQAIVMLADSIEAASRAMANPAIEVLEELIDTICRSKIASGQLSNSDLTFAEFEKCKQVFKQMMRSIYHARIEYPEDKSEEE